MNNIKIKAEVEEYIKIQIPTVPRNKTKTDKIIKSPLIVHQESKPVPIKLTEL